MVALLLQDYCDRALQDYCCSDKGISANETLFSIERALNNRAIDNYIKNLRKKISAVSNDSELIHSVYGVGYKFDGQCWRSL
jgi:hypothetical protein